MSTTDTAAPHSRLVAAAAAFLRANGDGPDARQALVEAAVHPLRYCDTDPVAAELQKVVLAVVDGERTDEDVLTEIAFLEQQTERVGPKTRSDADPPTPEQDSPSSDRLEELRAKRLDSKALDALPPPQPLIDGILYRNTLALLYGRPGTGKSFVAGDWALHVATGSWWHRREVHRGPVLYIAAEGSAGLAQRKHAWCEHHRLHDLDGMFWLPDTVNLLNPDWSTALAHLVDEMQPALVVIDTLARSMVGGDENAAADMGRVIWHADQLRKRSGCTVLLVHHTPKDGNGARGHSSLEGAADTVIELVADGAAITLKNVPPRGKQKDAPPFDDIRLARIPVGESCVVVDSRQIAGEPDLSPGALEMLQALAEVALADGVSTSVWMASCGVAARTYYRWQKRLAELGLTASTGEGNQKRWHLTDQGVRALEA